VTRTPEIVVLTDEDLAFFRLTCDLFPAPESPLRYLEDEDAQPRDAGVTFASLEERGLLNTEKSGAAQGVLDRLTPVGECSGRVTLAVHGPQVARRDFYLAAGSGVEYSRDIEHHRFGPPCDETAVVAELARHFEPSAVPTALDLSLSASDYLVFAVFARDVRAAPETHGDGDAPMSVDEVLAYFDEPETKEVQAPSDETWQASIDTLTAAGVLVAGPDGVTLNESLHPLAREIVADHQHTVTRLDFLDDHWLVREVSLYPTADAVYRFGTEPDGSVAIEELSAASLTDTLASVVGTLPNLLNPDAPPSFKHPMMGGRVPG
jgi:hypothetical protein